MNARVLKRFVIYMAILTFVMFTVWALIRSFMSRPPGDYETEVCDMRLKDKLYDKAIQAANTALEKTPNHRGAIMCKALVFISQKMYLEANEELNYLINFLEKNLEDDDPTGKGTLAAAYANRGIIKDRKNMKIFVLHPENKISEVQRKFMTTVNSSNVFNIALGGNFDDCQIFVKTMYAD